MRQEFGLCDRAGVKVIKLTIQLVVELVHVISLSLHFVLEEHIDLFPVQVDLARESEVGQVRKDAVNFNWLLGRPVDFETILIHIAAQSGVGYRKLLTEST